MDIQSVLALAQAGFTPEQITALLPMIASKPATPQDTAPTQAPAPEHTPEPAPAPEPAPKQEARSDPSLADIMAQVTKLGQMVASGAVYTSSQQLIPSETAEDALASIVIPKTRNI